MILLAPLSILASKPLPNTQGPTLVVFLAKGCPCNARCMPDLNRLARLLDRRVPMVGLVVGGAASDLPGYRTRLGCAFPLRFDPQGARATRAGAVCSLDMVLLDAKGRSVKLWEGIGRPTVADLGRELTRRFGVKKGPDPSGFDEIVQTGCRLGVCYPLKAAVNVP